MRLSFLGPLIATFLGVAAINEDSITKVYELASKSVSSDVVSNHDSLIYFIDKLNIDSTISLEAHNVDFISSHHFETSKPKLFIEVNGGEGLFEEPSFTIKGKQYDLFSKLTKGLKEYDQVDLTPEIVLFSNKVENNLIKGFTMFNEVLFKLWASLKDEERGLRRINDKFFITELTSLNLLKSECKNKDDVIFVNSNALVSIGRKIGYKSHTFNFSTKVLKDFLIELGEQFDVTVFVPATPTELTGRFVKRSSQLDKIFNFNTNSLCFSTEEACQVSTSNCNSHGVCSKVSSCWSCLCSPTFNKTTLKTTKWAGSDCGKKNVSAEANLFLWTTLFLLVLLVGGIKLLVSIGEEPLPNVLDIKL